MHAYTYNIYIFHPILIHTHIFKKNYMYISGSVMSSLYDFYSNELCWFFPFFFHTLPITFLVSAVLDQHTHTHFYKRAPQSCSWWLFLFFFFVFWLVGFCFDDHVIEIDL
jgi:hypothetical protein